MLPPAEFSVKLHEVNILQPIMTFQLNWRDESHMRFRLTLIFG